MKKKLLSEKKWVEKYLTGSPSTWEELLSSSSYIKTDDLVDGELKELINTYVDTLDIKAKLENKLYDLEYDPG